MSNDAGTSGGQIQHLQSGAISQAALNAAPSASTVVIPTPYLTGVVSVPVQMRNELFDEASRRLKQLESELDAANSATLNLLNQNQRLRMDSQQLTAICSQLQSANGQLTQQFANISSTMRSVRDSTDALRRERDEARAASTKATAELKVAQEAHQLAASREKTVTEQGQTLLRRFREMAAARDELMLALKQAVADRDARSQEAETTSGQLQIAQQQIQALEQSERTANERCAQALGAQAAAVQHLDRFQILLKEAETRLAEAQQPRPQPQPGPSTNVGASQTATGAPVAPVPVTDRFVWLQPVHLQRPNLGNDDTSGADMCREWIKRAVVPVKRTVATIPPLGVGEAFGLFHDATGGRPGITEREFAEHVIAMLGAEGVRIENDQHGVWRFANMMRRVSALRVSAGSGPIPSFIQKPTAESAPAPPADTVEQPTDKDTTPSPLPDAGSSDDAPQPPSASTPSRASPVKAEPTTPGVVIQSNPSTQDDDVIRATSEEPDLYIREPLLPIPGLLMPLESELALNEDEGEGEGEGTGLEVKPTQQELASQMADWTTTGEATELTEELASLQTRPTTPMFNQPAVAPVQHVWSTARPPDGTNATWGVLRPAIEGAVLEYLGRRALGLPGAAHETAFDAVVDTVSSSVRSLPLALPALFGPMLPGQLQNTLPAPRAVERLGMTPKSRKRKRQHPIVIEDSDDEELARASKRAPATTFDPRMMEQFPLALVKRILALDNLSQNSRFLYKSYIGPLEPKRHSVITAHMYRNGRWENEAHTFLISTRESESGTRAEEFALYLGAYVLRPAGRDPGTRLVCVGYSAVLVEALRTAAENLQVSQQV